MSLLGLVLFIIIWPAGQQEPEKESGGSIDEVTRQLETQALDEKEKDDDDEGKTISLIFVFRKARKYDIL